MNAAPSVAAALIAPTAFKADKPPRTPAFSEAHAAAIQAAQQLAAALKANHDPLQRGTDRFQGVGAKTYGHNFPPRNDIYRTVLGPASGFGG